MHSHSRRRFLVGSLALCLANGCSRDQRDEVDYPFKVAQTWTAEGVMHGDIVQFESVFWEPADTISLRKLIVEDGICSSRDVLEIGTGTGLIAVLCLQYNANSVVATDINPAAVNNAKYNIAMLTESTQADVRQVPHDAPMAFSTIGDRERFDLILSNPPWEDGTVEKPAEHAFYDPNFALMDSLLDGLPQHLNIGGRCLLAYGHLPAIERLLQQATQRGYGCKILDDRKLEDLETDFLPGMLIEVTVPAHSLSSNH
ncbi:methyltransferase [Novipirellula caenicola]|uniref:methyltransferase n=1 Tax=Novipirellula caenicola TaxID=1536901 RepID=UPI0031EE06F7